MHLPAGESWGDSLPGVGTEVPGPIAQAHVERLALSECPALTSRRRRRQELSGADHDPIVWVRALGTNVLDTDGNVFVDLTAGFGVAFFGHTHPVLREALVTQSERLVHAFGDVHPSDVKIALEQRLTEVAPWADARVILGLSGADAIEAALKTAVLATGRAGVIAFDGGYHGLGHGPLAACGYSAKFRVPFAGQLNPEVWFLPYPSRKNQGDVGRALEGAAKALATGRYGAVLIEPVQGRGGVTEGDVEAMAQLCRLAERHGAVVIADEIYTGCLRCADEMTLSSTWSVKPGMVVLGKPLGGGLAVSACLMREDIARAWGAPDGEAIHTSTFLGNPLGCATALAALGLMADPAERALVRAQAGALWGEVLEPTVADSRLGAVSLGGVGLLAGMVLEGGLPRVLRVVREMLVRGYLLLPGGVRGDQLTFTPPARLSGRQRVHLRETLATVLGEVCPR
ncbi:MAG: aminotransferase class III-fold pyridoxal phosphate-dependent enzyme [Deltaproteobacteria bacterium]|nr:aminotransferase class III-fold pyridoxal phosphate-dependent enzyme [Deltaproteobacteria bacterium]